MSPIARFFRACARRYRPIPLAAAVLAALPAWGQYAGPAILSRGEAPSSIDRSAILFQPFVEFLGTYNTGLAAVAVGSNGDLANASSFGYGLSWGVSGSHSWKRTSVGLAYHGSGASYVNSSFYDTINQSLLLSLGHRLNKHASFNAGVSTGLFSRGYGLGALQESISFDPTYTYVPQTDFFDNRTYYFGTFADMTFHKSTRLSFRFGGDFMDVRRRSSALYGSSIEDATGDVQYRLTRRLSIGASYGYLHFGFTKGIGTTDAHEFAGTFSYALNRRMEFSSFVGVSRVENKFLESVPIDPVIAALLGISGSTQIVHNIGYVPYYGARLSRTFHTGILYGGSWYRVVPGNGLFLSSYALDFSGGYNYTGLRRWTMGSTVSYDRAQSVGNITGFYTTKTYGMNLGRKTRGPLHVMLSYAGTEYDSPEFAKYHRFVHQVSLGIGFAPGEIPIRFW